MYIWLLATIAPIKTSFNLKFEADNNGAFVKWFSVYLILHDGCVRITTIHPNYPEVHFMRTYQYVYMYMYLCSPLIIVRRNMLYVFTFELLKSVVCA